MKFIGVLFRFVTAIGGVVDLIKGAGSLLAEWRDRKRAEAMKKAANEAKGTEELADAGKMAGDLFSDDRK